MENNNYCMSSKNAFTTSIMVDPSMTDIEKLARIFHNSDKEQLKRMFPQLYYAILGMIDTNKNHTYTAYYYDSDKDSGWGGDKNHLIINGKFHDYITCVRTSTNLAELMPRCETENIVMIVPMDTRLDIENYNPWPDDI